jgi:hypothetical protein
MRQFLLTLGTADTSGKAYSALLEGEIGIYNIVNGAYTPLAANTPIKNGAIIQRRAIGDKVIPFSTNDFSSEKMVYSAPTTFSATLDLSSFTTVNFPNEATILIIKKGVPLNMRYQFINTVHVFNSADITMAVASLVRAINSKAAESGITATLAGTTITFTATNPGDDYEIVPGDLLTGYEANISVTTIGAKAMGDWAMIKDLSRRAAADDGFEYTYYENYAQLHPGYPIERSTTDSANANSQFTIYTFRYAEPRKMKTVDEVVHQIVQIACPNSGAAVTGIDKLIGIVNGVTAGVVPQVVATP